jgi:hypothetical protein
MVPNRPWWTNKRIKDAEYITPDFLKKAFFRNFSGLARDILPLGILQGASPMNPTIEGNPKQIDQPDGL